MIAGHSNSICRKARLYYYDFLGSERREVVPGPIIDHIGQCQHCLEQVGQLDTTLSCGEDEKQGETQVNTRCSQTRLRYFAEIT